MTCIYCGVDEVMDTSDKEYQKLYKIYKELYEAKIKGIDIDKKEKPVKYCSNCGSIFREYMCDEKHICTAFKFCPICGKDASLSC